MLVSPEEIDKTLSFAPEWHTDGTSDTGETKMRWTDVTLYKLSGGMYVVLGAGRSDLPTETDRYWVRFSSDARALVKSLIRKRTDGRPHLPEYARQALDEAAFLDKTIDTALKEWEAAQAWVR